MPVFAGTASPSRRTTSVSTACYGLPPGQYYITAQPQQQQAFQSVGPNSQTEGAEARNGYARTFYPGTADVSRAQKVTVGIGQTLTEINFMLLPTRLATISGVAVDPQGQPLGRGFVQIDAARWNDDAGRLRRRTVAPGRDVYRAECRARHVHAAGHRAAQQRRTGTPAGLPEFSVAVVTVNGEDVTDVRLTPRGACHASAAAYRLTIRPRRSR